MAKLVTALKGTAHVALLIIGTILGCVVGFGLWLAYWKLFPQGSPFNDNWSTLATGERVQEVDPWDTIVFFISLAAAPIVGLVGGFVLSGELAAHLMGSRGGDE